MMRLINYLFFIFILGIDFGLTFGAGTRDLNIPEMVPFRLTPQFVNTMNPLGTSGFMSKCMIHVLRALRANSKLLIACMDVFVHEPTIDWLDSARIKIIDDYDNVSLSSSGKCCLFLYCVSSVKL